MALPPKVHGLLGCEDREGKGLDNCIVFIVLYQEVGCVLLFPWPVLVTLPSQQWEDCEVQSCLCLEEEEKQLLKRSSNFLHMYQGDPKGSSEHSLNPSLNEMFNPILPTRAVCEFSRSAKTFNSCPFYNPDMKWGHESMLHCLIDPCCPDILRYIQMSIFIFHCEHTQ